MLIIGEMYLSQYMHFFICIFNEYIYKKIIYIKALTIHAWVNDYRI